MTKATDFAQNCSFVHGNGPMAETPDDCEVRNIFLASVRRGFNSELVHSTFEALQTLGECVEPEPFKKEFMEIVAHLREKQEAYRASPHYNPQSERLILYGLTRIDLDQASREYQQSFARLVDYFTSHDVVMKHAITNLMQNHHEEYKKLGVAEQQVIVGLWHESVGLNQVNTICFRCGQSQ